MHREVPVKVNAMIDEGIAPLVLALNEEPRLLTVDSCQGDGEDSAYVYMLYGGPAAHAAAFFTALAQELAKDSSRSADYELRLEWRTGNMEPLARLSTPRQSVPDLASTVRNAITAVRNTAVRTNACFCDT
jgi:hypothetical protein